MKLAVLLVCATILVMVMVTSARKMKDADLDAVVDKQIGDSDLLNDPIGGMYAHIKVDYIYRNVIFNHY